MLVSMLIEH